MNLARRPQRQLESGIAIRGSGGESRASAGPARPSLAAVVATKSGRPVPIRRPTLRQSELPGLEPRMSLLAGWRRRRLNLASADRMFDPAGAGGSLSLSRALDRARKQ
jgi:hypothetical protein